MKNIANFIKDRIFMRSANLNWMLFNRILSMPIELFVGLYVARFLGPEKLGQLNYTVSLVALFSILVNLGVDSVIVRDIIKDDDKKHEILGSVLALKLIGCSILFVLSNVYSLLSKKYDL